MAEETDPKADLEPKGQRSYFGVDDTRTIVLDDGVSQIQHKVMNEGQRKRFQDRTNRDIRVAKQTGDAHLKMMPAAERHELLKTAIVGWNLVDGDGKELSFGEANLNRFLQSANPRVVDFIEKEIRKANPWLQTEMSSDEIRQEIDDLTELLDVKLAEEAGNAAS